MGRCSLKLVRDTKNGGLQLVPAKIRSASGSATMPRMGPEALQSAMFAMLFSDDDDDDNNNDDDDDDNYNQ